MVNGGTSGSDTHDVTATEVARFGLALWVIATTVYLYFDTRLEILLNLYAGLGAQLPLPLRIHILSARSLSWVVLLLVAIAAAWLWRRDPDGLLAAKLISGTGLMAMVWTIVGLLLGLYTTIDLTRALP